MPDSKFYVYQHVRNDVGNIFYVGKGKGNRYKSARPTHRNQRWLRTVAKAGGFQAIKIAEHLDEELAFLAEIERIDQLRRLGVDLCNMTKGGDGASGFRHSEETKKRMSVKWKYGRVMSLAQREAISKRQRGLIISDDTRRKMSAAHTGRVHTKETKQKLSKIKTGVKLKTPVSDQTRIKLSEAMKGDRHPMFGKHHTEESKKKISEAKKGLPVPCLGRKATDEARKNMSQAQIGSKSHLFGTKQELVECPHCGKFGGCRTMRRWHFDNCKSRK